MIEADIWLGLFLNVRGCVLREVKLGFLLLGWDLAKLLERHGNLGKVSKRSSGAVQDNSVHHLG